MFQVSLISSHTGAQPSTPLVICFLDDMLLQTRPCFRSASQEWASGIDMLVYDTPDFIVNWIQVRTIVGPEAAKCGVAYIWRCIVCCKNCC